MTVAWQEISSSLYGGETGQTEVCAALLLWQLLLKSQPGINSVSDRNSRMQEKG